MISKLKNPYLIFIGDTDDTSSAKTGAGIIKWCPELVAGQLRFEGNDFDLGVPNLTIDEAVEKGVKSIIIGVAPVGGRVGPDWIEVLTEAANLGLDIVSGLHMRLEEFSELVDASKKSGASLINVRTPSKNLPIGSGIKRAGNRLLMVGTDCAVGKKYSALAIDKAMKARGIDSTFRATGQTGMMISGEGEPVDSVISDFISGAAETISPGNKDGHWDVIEGQGSLFNPSYSGVSMGLLHGSQPDAFVLCHEPGREICCSGPEVLIPSLQDCIDLHISCGKIVSPDIKCVGISLNTSGMSDDDRKSYITKIQGELSLPCIDPIIDGPDAIIDFMKID